MWREKGEKSIKRKESNLVREKRGSQKPRSAIGSPGEGSPIVGNFKPIIQRGCEPKYWPIKLKLFWARIAA